MFWSLSFSNFLWLVNWVFFGLLYSSCIATWLFLHWSLLLLCCYLGLFALLLNSSCVVATQSSCVATTQSSCVATCFSCVVAHFLALLFDSFYCCSAFLISLLQFFCCYLIPLIFVWLLRAWAPLAPTCVTCFLLCCHSTFLVII